MEDRWECKMWRVAIVDDQLSIRTQMQSYFERYQEDHQQQFRISSFGNAELFLDQYKPVYDIVLMDIDMPGMNGLSAAHRLRKLDEQVVLMFVTNLTQYAINGYEVSAVDYVIKPLDYAKFEFKLTRALGMVPPKNKSMVFIKTEEGIVSVEQDDVTYVEVQGHNLFYHTKSETYRIRGSLKQAEAELLSPRFFTCNKCYIVNLAYVEEIKNNNVAIVAGDEVMISRPKKKAFMEALAAYYNN